MYALHIEMEKILKDNKKINSNEKFIRNKMYYSIFWNENTKWKCSRSLRYTGVGVLYAVKEPGDKYASLKPTM